MHFDLGTFRDNLSTLHQIDILHNSLFIKLLFMPFFVNFFMPFSIFQVIFYQSSRIFR